MRSTIAPHLMAFSTIPLLRSCVRPEPRLASPARYCMTCGAPLIQTRLNRYVAFVCDNWRCTLFRERQGYKEVEPRPSSENTSTAPGGRNPEAYLRYLTQRRENYRMLRQVGVPPVEASRLTSNRQARLTLQRDYTPSP